jgi:hypothetical protein
MHDRHSCCRPLPPLTVCSPQQMSRNREMRWMAVVHAAVRLGQAIRISSVDPCQDHQHEKLLLDISTPLTDLSVKNRTCFSARPPPISRAMRNCNQ